MAAGIARQVVGVGVSETLPNRIVLPLVEAGHCSGAFRKPYEWGGGGGRAIVRRGGLGVVSPHLPAGKKFLRFCLAWPA